MQDGKEQHKKYILNGNALKDYYQRSYLDNKEKEYKCLFKKMTDELFPKFLIFNVDILDWEPIKLPLSVCPVRADTPNDLHQHWSKANRVPQDDPVSVVTESRYPEYQNVYDFEAFMLLTKKPINEKVKEKLIKTHIETCKRAISNFNEGQINLLNANLDSPEEYDLNEDEQKTSTFSHSSCYFSSFKEKRNCTFKIGDRYSSWISDIDKYILNIFNGREERNYRDTHLRLKLDAIIPFHAPLVATLILRRIIGLCKVLLFFFFVESLQ